MDNVKAAAAFLGAPIGGFVVGVLAWTLFRAPDPSPGIFGIVGEHLGPWHDAKSAVTAIAMICTVLSWILIASLWASGRE